MTPFILLPVPVQNAVCFWTLVTCLGEIANMLLSFRQKRFGLFASSTLCFFLSYFMLHVLREGTEFRLNGSASDLALYLLNGPFAVYLIVPVMISGYCIWAFISIQKWKSIHITSAAIKESLDHLPAGICFYFDDGRCILVNHRMNDICFLLSGRYLQNGMTFFEQIKDTSVRALPDGTAVSFRHRVIKYQGAPLHELIADDITEVYKKSEVLRKDNEKAGQLAASMKQYGETITDTVRRQEILQAKVNIHDEMNRMILATKKTIDGPSTQTERDDILKMWRTQTLLLCREADTTRSTNVVSDLNALAASLGIRILWEGEPNTDRKQVLILFLSAAREAMTNAAKHGGAGILSIRVSESDTTLCASFTNDGQKPASRPVESGGLKILREQLEAAGGQMRTDISDGFELSIIIPKEEKADAL